MRGVTSTERFRVRRDFVRTWRHASAAALALAVCGANLGCGTPDDRIVARALPSATEPPPVRQPGPRGRVKVVDGTVVTDVGTLLRGVTAPIDIDPGFELGRSTLQELALETGVNALHIFLENYTDAAGVNEAVANVLVEETAAAGLYLIIGIGGGPSNDEMGNGWFDLQKVLAFWSHYAPLYAERPHVIYEIQNNPELECEVALRPATFEMEEQAYELIRSLAPQTHIAMFSFAGLPTRRALDAALDRVQGRVDWSNASIVAQGNERCVPFTGYAELIGHSRSRSAAMLLSELPGDGWIVGFRQAEANGAGWFHHDWLSDRQDLDGFRREHNAAGLTWCPDYGTWPQDSATCL